MVAAAGGHNILLSGPPGTGKTLLARAFSELLPSLNLAEAIDVARIYSSAGLLKDSDISFLPPFRSPHHTISAPALIGGGTHPKPGEISLAHLGVLFLDELPEFPRNVLESLRQPLEEGIVTVSRTAGHVTLPARFMLVAAMNPCPCGNYGDEKLECVCLPYAVVKYRKKISGPLLDRIDIQIVVPREIVRTRQIQDVNIYQDMKKKIENARTIQRERFKGKAIRFNSEIGHRVIDKLCALDDPAEDFLEQAVNVKNLSLRTYHKLKKIARTVADLDGSEQVKQKHVAEALALRLNEKITEI